MPAGSARLRLALLSKPVHGVEASPVAGPSRRWSRVAVRRDGKILASASGGADACIKLWDLETRKEIATLPGHKGGVNSVAFSPDGALLASGGDDKTVKLWDVDKKQADRHAGRSTAGR